MKSLIYAMVCVCALAICNPVEAQIFRRTGLLARISQASGCSSQSAMASSCSGSESAIRVRSAEGCSGQAAQTYRAYASQAVQMPVRTIQRTVVPMRATPMMNCPNGVCPISMPVVRSEGYHSHRTMDGRIITHADSNHGNADAHRGIAYPWYKISKDEWGDVSLDLPDPYKLVNYRDTAWVSLLIH